MRRRNRSLVVCGVLGLSLLVAGNGKAQTPNPFLRKPDIHGDQVVFTAEGDLWLGSLKMKEAQRITSAPGVETNAHFSPDGKMIAFTGQYDGGTDVYVMPTTGGEPKRLTYDPTGATVTGWTPDGKAILFRSRRESPEYNNRLFSVPVGGGLATRLPIPQCDHASMSRDARRVAFVPVSAEWQHWFRYQGGEADDVWLTDLQTHTFKRLTTWPGVDTTPIWAGDTLYCISERDGLANLYRLDPNGGKMTPATHFTDYEIRYPASDGTKIVFQHGNGLGLYDPQTGRSDDLAFTLHSDRIHARTRRVSLSAMLHSVAIGPTGKRLLLESRGQIVSVPVKEGDLRPVAPLPGSRSQFPVWSPDGKSCAFVSDRSGEEQVWIAPTTGTGAPRQLSSGHQGPLDLLRWSPDGKAIATSDREARILLIDATTGTTTLVDQSPFQLDYDEDINTTYRFSPDGKWLAYAARQTNWNLAVFLYNIATKQKIAVSNPEMNATSPAFDPTGKYLYFLSDRALGGTTGLATHFNFASNKITKISLVTLASDTPSPFLLTNDEEGATPKADKPAASTPGSLPTVKVDVEGLTGRVIDVPMPAGFYQTLDALPGKILVSTLDDASLSAALAGGDGDPTQQLLAFDLKEKKSTLLAPKLSEFALSGDGSKLLVRDGNSVSVVDAGAPVAPGAGAVSLGAYTLEVDPAQEWKQIFREAWRVSRDFFYDPNLHGVNWQAVRSKYEAQLPYVGDRSDLNAILGDLLAELNAGHAFVGGGDLGDGPRRIGLGFLGADLEPAGANAVKITKLYPGDGFELTQVSPLLAPGVNAHVGDYIVAIAGRPVKASEDIGGLLLGTAGQIVTVSLNSKPTLDGARQVQIRPLADEGKLRYYDWVATRREYVVKNGSPNLGYLHIPDMGASGREEFNKHYAANLEKDGIVYDVRNNGGGNISAQLLVQMATRPFAWFKPRYGASWTRTDWGFSGYGAALCNERSGSNAEEFCDAFQRLKLGPVIGARTWGGEVGSGSGHDLLDGGKFYVPNYGEWVSENGKSKWVIEGTGAQPDMPVAQDPAVLLAGGDPQLDRAIAYLKEQIAHHPVVRPTPPTYPVKAPRTYPVVKSASKQASSSHHDELAFHDAGPMVTNALKTLQARGYTVPQGSREGDYGVRGRVPMTNYEIAVGLVRTLDHSAFNTRLTAHPQDVPLVRQLVNALKPELTALGATVSDIETQLDRCEQGPSAPKSR